MQVHARKNLKQRAGSDSACGRKKIKKHRERSGPARQLAIPMAVLVVPVPDNWEAFGNLNRQPQTDNAHKRDGSKGQGRGQPG